MRVVDIRIFRIRMVENSRLFLETVFQFRLTTIQKHHHTDAIEGEEHKTGTGRHFSEAEKLTPFSTGYAVHSQNKENPLSCIAQGNGDVLKRNSTGHRDKRHSTLLQLGNRS